MCQILGISIREKRVLTCEVYARVGSTTLPVCARTRLSTLPISQPLAAQVKCVGAQRLRYTNTTARGCSGRDGGRALLDLEISPAADGQPRHVPPSKGLS
eukprot:352987-Chlamydomonas_euryale.AAC.7